MARPTGRFHSNALQLYEQLKYLGANKSNVELAKDMEVSVTQVSKYLQHLRKLGAITISTSRYSLGSGFKSHRSIEVK